MSCIASQNHVLYKKDYMKNVDILHFSYKLGVDIRAYLTYNI